MDIKYIDEFVVFSRYLNFSKAARQLNLAQPTLSNHIASLERELGFLLVQRGKDVHLTAAGKRFCANAERFISALEATVDECRAIAKRRSGELVFERPIHQGGVDRAFQMVLLKFQEAHPEISVKKRTSHDLSVKEVLAEGLADVVFLFNDSGAFFGNDFTERVAFLPTPHQGFGPFFLWMDKGHPLAEHESLTSSELDNCKFLIPSSIRYQSLENLARASSEECGANVICSYWPGSYEECIMNIRPDEMMIVAQSDIADPAYSLVPNRVLVRLEGFEELLKPSFVYMIDNDNPALETFTSFIGELNGQTR